MARSWRNAADSGANDDKHAAPTCLCSWVLCGCLFLLPQNHSINGPQGLQADETLCNSVYADAQHSCTWSKKRSCVLLRIFGKTAKKQETWKKRELLVLFGAIFATRIDSYTTALQKHQFKMHTASADHAKIERQIPKKQTTVRFTLRILEVSHNELLHLLSAEGAVSTRQTYKNGLR